MKKVLFILLFVIACAYYFVPNNIKIDFFDTIGIDGSLFLIDEGVTKYEKGEVINLKFDNNTHKTIFKGNISNGEMIKDLSWASKPYVKCFYKDNYKNFDGNTVHHRVLLGKNKNIEVKLITENKNISMYVYKTEPLSKVFPPKKEYVNLCKISINNSNNTINMKGNTITSDIVIGVVGSNGNVEGDYTLELTEK